MHLETMDCTKFNSLTNSEQNIFEKIQREKL